MANYIANDHSSKPKNKACNTCGEVHVFFDKKFLKVKDDASLERDWSKIDTSKLKHCGNAAIVAFKLVLPSRNRLSKSMEKQIDRTVDLAQLAEFFTKYKETKSWSTQLLVEYVVSHDLFKG
jgi:uncharacterized protein YabN with tetrapyrrole methylase and pyrophosphatase domain